MGLADPVYFDSVVAHQAGMPDAFKVLEFVSDILDSTVVVPLKSKLLDRKQIQTS